MSAASTANVLAMWNAWLPPPRTGGSEWSSYPQLHTGPPPASSVRSVAGSWARVPVRPNGVTDTQMSSSWSARRSGWSRCRVASASGWLALEDDVGLAGEAAEVVGAGVGVEVEHDPALRRVVVPPPEAAFRVLDVVGERPVGPAGMAAGRFHHDHVGAEVAEHLPGERGVLAGQLDDPQAEQGPRRLGGVAHVTPSFASCSISASSSPRISDSTR